MREVLPPPDRDVRAVRASPRDRSQSHRRRPGPVRDLLDRPYGRMRELWASPPVPWRAARPDALQQVRPGRRAAVRALPAGAAADGPLARGPGVQHLLSPGSVGEGHLPGVRAHTPVASLPRVHRIGLSRLRGRRGRSRLPSMRCRGSAPAAGTVRTLHPSPASDRAARRRAAARPRRPRRTVRRTPPRAVGEGYAAVAGRQPRHRDPRQDRQRRAAMQPRDAGRTRSQPRGHAPSASARRHRRAALARSSARAVRALDRATSSPRSDAAPELRTFAYWIVLRRCRRTSRRAPLGEG